MADRGQDPRLTVALICVLVLGWVPKDSALTKADALPLCSGGFAFGVNG
jgi:hypothetical protein